MPDLTHLSGRVAVPEGTPESAEAIRSRALHEYYAAEYLRRLGSAEGPGAGIAYLGELRHRTEDADPWHLLELVAAKAVARQPRRDG